MRKYARHLSKSTNVGSVKQNRGKTHNTLVQSKKKTCVWELSTSFHASTWWKVITREVKKCMCKDSVTDWCIENQQPTLSKTIKVRSLFKDGKQTAGCTNFCTETRLRRPVSVRNSVHPAVCLQSLKRERTLESWLFIKYFGNFRKINIWQSWCPCNSYIRGCGNGSSFVQMTDRRMYFVIVIM